jgi:zinc transporter 1/2/3
MMASLFSLFVIEMYLKAKTGGHSHGGPTGEGLSAPPPATGVSAPPRYQGRPDTRDSYYPDEKDIGYTKGYEVDDYERESSNDIRMYGLPSEMPPWFQVFFAQYIRQREELKQMITTYAPKALRPAPNAPAPEPVEDAIYAEPVIDEATFKKMNLNITLLEGGILFHSVFVGMTVSITTDGFIVLLIAILFHQFFEGLGLGSRIAAVPYKKGAAKPWILVVAFGTTAPIGQAIGLIARNSYDPQSAFALIIVGVFNAM